jgi:hypothetical protein
MVWTYTDLLTNPIQFVTTTDDVLLLNPDRRAARVSL